MGERESHPPGTISWADLSTTDAAGAKAFYGPLMEWEFEDRPAGEGMTYTMAFRRGRDVAGIGEDASQPPHWNTYVTVEGADAAAERAVELGATVVAPPFDVLDAGRMTVVQDPSGAFICAWEPRAHPGARLVNEPGAMTWNELVTRDLAAARAFYEGWLGWTFEELPGSDGYHVIRIGERTNGGMQPVRPQMGPDMPSAWMPYFGVADLDAALAAVAASGGQRLTEPIAVPAGRFAVIADPQGAACALWHGPYDD